MSVLFVDSLRRGLGSRHRVAFGRPGFRPTAVLVPIVLREGQPHVLFTVRDPGLAVHAGQISFPGGKCEDDDSDRIATALREAHEELGIAAEVVEVLGMLDDEATPSRFIITPVVGLLREPSYTPNGAEVAEAFEVPVAELRDPAAFEDHGSVELDSHHYWLCAYRPRGRNIWGATARMLKQLFDAHDLGAG